MRKWAILLISGAALGGVLAYCYDGSSLEGIRANLLTIIFTVTTFSVTFSIAGFNSSAYRQFHRSIPPRLLAACLAVLAITLGPLALLVFIPAAFVPTCLFVLPLLLLAGAILLGLGRRETDPIFLLNRLCSVHAIRQHLRALAPKVASRIAETEALALSKPTDQPMHEVFWHLAVAPEPDEPLTHLATLGLLSIQHGDLAAFGGVMKRFLEVLEVADDMKLPDGHRGALREIRGQAFDAFERVTLALQRDKGTVAFCRVAIDALAEYVTSKTKDRQQVSDLAFSALHLMKKLGVHCYESGSKHESRVPIIVARLIAQKGLDDPPKMVEGKQLSADEALFDHRLAAITHVIKEVGTWAIEKGDMELLYRCFEAFGWLGCSAVKNESENVANACLRGLSQLGRVVRNEGLECFWSHCPLRPEDHAQEHMRHMATWLGSMSDEQRAHWVGLFESAFSRFHGKEVEFACARQSDGKLRINMKLSEKDHVEGFMMHGGSRDVNYADFKFLKDLELHNGRGIVMQGPVVPLSFAADKATPPKSPLTPPP